MTPHLNPSRPASYPRRILVSTLGLAPQILTETLYCLAKMKKEPFVPGEIHVITTSDGARRAYECLLAPQFAKLAQLECDHNIPGLSDALDETRIHVIATSFGGYLDDIDSAEDNAATADLITGLIRTLAADTDCALHVSIAGWAQNHGLSARLCTVFVWAASG